MRRSLRRSQRFHRLRFERLLFQRRLRLVCPILTRICGAPTFTVMVVEDVSAVLASAAGTNPNDAIASASTNSFFIFYALCSI
jgi:hypothetical protein